MKTKISTTASGLLLRMRSYFQGESVLKKTYKEEQPLRSELFSAWQMQKHGTKVAASHRVMSGKNSDKLLKRLDKNEDVLLQVRDLLVEALRDKLPLTPASEWLLDNFYLIEEQISIGRKHLPKGYSQNLPHLLTGASAGFPRVYDIALEIISHSDGRVDLINLSSFINAYQKQSNLTLGELWAIPIMLRLALIENLRRVAVSIALDRIDQNIAGYWAGKLLEDAESQPKNIILTVADMARTGPVLSSCFVAEFTRRLQGKGAGLALPLSWVDQQLVETGYTSSELIHMENQSQAADQVSMRNSIESLRLLRTTEWRDFVESISSVDQVLKEDAVYSQMDFTTRDTYRHVIESIAQKSPLSETDIANIALQLSKNSKDNQEDYRKRHVGYYLIDKGIGQTQKEARMVCTFSDKLKAFVLGRRLFYYSGGIVIGTLVLCLLVCLFAYQHQVHYGIILIVFILSFIGGSQLAIALANWIVTRTVKPRMLPKMEYGSAVPDEDATLIAVPCMLTSLTGIEELVEALEVRYLANPHKNLFYSLIADYKDADKSVLPDDHNLLQHAIKNIEGLNNKYKGFVKTEGQINADGHTNPSASNTPDIFYLFVRNREWSEGEKVWMGRERKRGKLGDLNQFLLQRKKTQPTQSDNHTLYQDQEQMQQPQYMGAFASITGNLTHLPAIKYVITLDADTRLPREAAAKMIATMAHPLNQPLYDLTKGRVVAGHGILQPRVAVTLPKSTSSLFVRMHSMDSGLDPYTRVSSDVYQDLYGEGSFIGKGIYQVEVFEEALAGRFPENRILSHDLLEGCYLRSGLISDIALFEDYPDRYLLDSSRQHRWIRGDWQILSWALPWAPGADGRLHKNPLSGLSKWKIADNLRRSLVAPSLVILLCIGWLMLPYPWLWTTCVIAVFVVPILLNSLWHLLHKPKDVDMKPHLREFAWKTWENFLIELFYIACLPYEAWQHLEAIAKTIWRMTFTKKHLLQWTPSGMLARKKRPALTGVYAAMWTAPFTALVIAIFLYQLSTDSFLVALPVLLLWLFAPALVWRTNQPKRQNREVLSEQDLDFLHQISRKTWLFFETFVTKEENYLPPDNYQEEPKAVIAHRTSPTNMGLSLLAALSAYDFGYIALCELIARTGSTLKTMQGLEKYQGHFYNWYDTLTLQPLPPRYISAVDSGNLAGHLITLRQGLLQLSFDPIISTQVFKGLNDTLLMDQGPHKDLNVYLIMQRKLQACLATVHANQHDLLFYYRNFMELAALSEQLIQQHQTIKAKAVSEKLSDIGQKLEQPAKAPEAAQAAALIQQTDFEANTSPKQVIAPTGIISCHRQLMALIDLIGKLAPWIPAIESAPPAELEALIQSFPWLTENAHLFKIKGYAKKSDSLSIMEDSARFQFLRPAQLQEFIEQGAEAAMDMAVRCVELAEICEQLADMDYSFLYDKSKHLLRIGYNVQERQADKSYYDLLASEARLGIYVAIAQGKIAQDSWFALGRLLTGVGKTPVLLSWSGSMFEYLMPQLVMPTYENTLLEQTSKGLIKRQIAFASSRNVPWGISESGYNTVDASLNYQYRAFGVPGLGLKRGLGEDLVIAPYATMLALMIRPTLATANLKRMAEKGYTGRYGFYEAIDYTKSRLPRGAEEAIIQSFMVHHQGMGFLALAYVLRQGKMQQRFEADPALQSSLLLLQEKIPRATIFYAHTPDSAQTGPATQQASMDIIRTPFTRHPEIKLLSNGHYHVMISNAGGGYSRWNDLAISRWREDGTMDNWGTFCYIKDLQEGSYWSNTYQPVLGTTDLYEAVFSQGHAEFRRKDDNIETRTEIVVSPEDNVEVRRIRITNKGSAAKSLEVTSYAEVVLAPQNADEAHPAFSNLFVETSILKDQQAILCTRRPRSSGEQPPWMFHLMSLSGSGVNAGAISYETDRARFIGRGRNCSNPAALEKAGVLSDSEGSVLDPIVSIRRTFELKAGQTATIDLIIGVAADQNICAALLDKYQDRHLKNRAFELSWTHSQVLLRQINATETEAKLYSKMAGFILYPSPALRAAPSIIASNNKSQSGLWAYAISGDLPIVLLRVQSEDNIGLIRQLINAHTYWRLKGIKADLVIWNENFGSYRQDLHEQIQSLIALANSVSINQQYGGIYLRSADQIPMEDRILMQTVARIIIDDQLGTLEEQISASQKAKLLPPDLEKTSLVGTRQEKSIISTRKLLPEGLVYNNGIGGFTKDGKEYIIRTSGQVRTPMPWSNVIANAEFGTVISESGGSYTWAGNAHEYRLTPWLNDPVQDSCGEAIYIRDEQTGQYWSPTPLPAVSKGDFITRHGFGYTVFEHTENGISSELWVFVDKLLPIRYQWLKLHNLSGRERKLSVTSYAEWVLGDTKGKTAQYIVTEKVPDTAALLAYNRYSSSYPGSVCFSAVNATKGYSLTADREAFIGRSGTMRSPAGLRRSRLSGKAGAALDPCAALQVQINLYADQETELNFRLGAGKDKAHALELIAQSEENEYASQALSLIHTQWNEILEQTTIQSPDPALNFLSSGWLTYQTLSCRIWGRSGYYQSGGAFGFRDQLQDVMALFNTRPDIAKQQIILSASRQFIQGDVQHWWHPPTGRGVRTRCSDDYLWLPFVLAQYVFTTGDETILECPVSFLDGRLLNEGEDSYYDLPMITEEKESLYQHALKAIQHGLRTGVHGLPLMGTGDWNDGMDKVGEKGKGESIWLGFFLFSVLTQFKEIALRMMDHETAEMCIQKAAALKTSLNQNGWDGQWYRRAYFDDGTPLGSSQNQECQIDSIAQSWSILSGAGMADKKRQALTSLDTHLVRPKEGVILLLDPAFDSSPLNPGYIKGYAPGVRENGGQYTHAAVWAMMAFAEMGERNKVWELFKMVSPVSHTMTRQALEIYKVEPYVMAADVYNAPQHRGRGGWTWYTGSAGWMQQFMFRFILGIRRTGDQLCFKPCTPEVWKNFKVDYKFGKAIYHIEVLLKPGNFIPKTYQVDGVLQQNDSIALIDDGKHHQVQVS
jgi:cellobiose phosphorylase